jgi:hypothetical protein
MKKVTTYTINGYTYENFKDLLIDNDIEVHDLFMDWLDEFDADDIDAMRDTDECAEFYRGNFVQYAYANLFNEFIDELKKEDDFLSEHNITRG